MAEMQYGDGVTICNNDFSCIYLITSPTGRLYVGQTVCLKKRLTDYRNIKYFGQRKLKHSFEKHGKETHVISVILKCDRADLNYWESFYINEFNTFNTNNGLNLALCS